MIDSNDSWDVNNTCVKKSGFRIIIAVSIYKRFYQRVYKSSNNTEIL